MQPIARRPLRLVAALVACWLVPASLQAAQPLPQPQGAVILTVTGRLAVTNGGDTARFDRAMLDRLPQTTLTSFTDWTSGEQSFTGVLLEDLLERLGADGSSITARALNDFAAQIPWADLGQHRVLLALTRNGADMPVRDKGPIWIIYRNERPPSATPFAHNDKMVWQLTRLDVQ
jgi:hypothetical protein